MSTLKATYLQQASSASPNITLDASTNATVAGTLAMGHSFKRNKIINGNMLIDQRNAGASVSFTAGGQYFVDRWCGSASAGSKMTAQQSSTAPTGFTTSLLVTSSTAWTVGATDYTTLNQYIEGFNIADLNWGTANAKTITVSFWVRCSLTGTFGALISNGTNSGTATRTYPFTYTISSANTWTYITVTLAGDTTGTWGSTNSGGVTIQFSMAAGSSVVGTPNTWAGTLYWGATGQTNILATNGATWYVTGVQLETGSIATPYERQIYSDQLAQCQRYCFKGTLYDLGRATDSTYPSNLLLLPVTMRSTPSFTAANGSYTVNAGSSGTPGYLFSSPNTVFLYNSASNWTATAFVQFTGFVTAEL